MRNIFSNRQNTIHFLIILANIICIIISAAFALSSKEPIIGYVAGIIANTISAIVNAVLIRSPI
jgi:hypothetical protein